MSGVDHIRGETVHSRRDGVKHSFRYSVDYLMLDPEVPMKAPFPLRRNRAGMMALHDADNGGPPGRGQGSEWVREVLREHRIDAADGPLLLITQPRVLGHVFNPVSFWLAHAPDGTLRATLAEVTNTFGDRHSYLCHHPDQRPIQAGDWLEAVKVLHVSPFQPVAGGYAFRFDIRPDRIGIWIDYREAGGGLMATLTGRRASATTSGLLGAMLRRPFGSRRVLALIHFQALRLWWKGARYRTRPEPPEQEISR